ncbi:callose synthase-like protein, partial [Trifolium pratense]
MVEKCWKCCQFSPILHLHLTTPKELVKRLYLLLAVKDTDANVPKNLEARAKPVSETLPF